MPPVLANRYQLGRALGDEALRWFAHMIRDRGFVAWPYFAGRDPFLASLRGEPRYESLLGEMDDRRCAPAQGDPR